MYNQSPSSSSKNNNSSSNQSMSVNFQNQGKNFAPWFDSRGQSDPNSGWIPSWNHISMDSSSSSNPNQSQQQQQHQSYQSHPQAQSQYHQQPQDHPNWHAGQLETPNHDFDLSRQYPSSTSGMSFQPPQSSSVRSSQQHQHQPQQLDQDSRPSTAKGPNLTQHGMPTPASTKASTTKSTPKPNSKSSFDTPEKVASKGESPTTTMKRPNKERAGGGQAKKKKTKQPIEPEDPPSEPEKDKLKRTKTGRACDACRTKKIRCDILRSEVSPSGLDSQPMCAHCKQSNVECTFFLPITETRFKKKRQAGKDAKDAALNVRRESDVEDNIQFDTSGGSPNTYKYENMGGGSQKKDDKGGGRVEGPTSIAFLLHTAIPTIQSEAFDVRHHNSWEVLEDGNGVIRVNAPPTAPAHADADPSDPTRAHNRLNKPVLSAQTMSLLVNAYFKDIAPLFPIISRAEFAAKSSPSPLMLYSICGLGATRRQFPREIFAGVRGVINGILRSNDILSDASFDNVQALLLLAQVGDLHAQPTAATASASLIRTGAAIRMAQDLGLHRESSLRAQGANDLAYVELRRRVWAACVIMDRWYGAALGIPLLVDLLDCDVLLPAPYEISSNMEPSEWPIEFNFMALGEHLKLSILMGRVLKTIYSPTGLKHTTDAQLAGLVSDMEKWKEMLPGPLRFNGRESPHVVGLLHLGYTALQFLFWRVFMRITYSCPPHLTFCVQVSHWTKMIQWSREALEWLDANDDALDTLFVFPYAATSCALIQYHTWARRGDTDALETLKSVKETATRWEQTVQPDQMSIRRKTCETMTLLYEAALKTDPESNENQQAPKLPVNPTAGVIPRQGAFSKIRFQKDESRSGGGVFVAQDESDRNLSGLHQHDVMLAAEISKELQEESQNQSRSATNIEGGPVERAAIVADQQGREEHDRDLTEHHNKPGGDEKEASSAILQNVPGGTYNLNPLIGIGGSFDYNQNVNPGQDNGFPSGGMDITRTGQQYPMPVYPLPQNFQQYNMSNNAQKRYDQTHRSDPNESPYTEMPNSYSDPATNSSMSSSNHNNAYGVSSNGYNGGYSNINHPAGSHHEAGPTGMSTNHRDNGNNQYTADQNQNQQQKRHGHGPQGPGHGYGHGNLDPSFLDSLPVSTFDWESWSDYFDKFLPSANQSFETMQ